MLSSSPEYDVTLQELLQQHEEQEAAAEEARQLLLESGDDKEIEEMLAEVLDAQHETAKFIATTKALQAIVIGTVYRFRHTDGQWHYGIARGKDLERVFMQFLRPTKAHMLSGVSTDPRLLKPVKQDLVVTGIPAGSRILAESRDGLWEPAELISSDQSGHRLMNCETGVAFYVGCDGIAESAYATDSEQESEGGKEGWQDVVSDSTEDLSGNEEEDETQLGQRQSSLLATGTSQGGLQTETEVFGSWEGCTRGIGSKLMVNMGFVKGGSLGKSRGGQLHPIEVKLFKPGAGLGSEGYLIGKADGTSAKKRSRGGTKRRKVKQRFAEREARRQQEGAQDRETGEMGVFALVNQQLGDNSEAAKIQRRSQETSLNAMSQQSNGRFSKPQQVQAPQDRKSLMASRDDVAAKRAKIAQLQAMQARNQKDAVMSKQITSKLQHANKELSALLSKQQNGVSALQNQEKQKKWLKF